MAFFKYRIECTRLFIYRIMNDYENNKKYIFMIYEQKKSTIS